MKAFSLLLPIFFLFLAGYRLSAQVDPVIMTANSEIKVKQAQIDSLKAIIEDRHLWYLRDSLEKFGLPRIEKDEELIKHAAMYLIYSEKHEQAKWVAHIISPQIVSGNFGRSNDFRPDPFVKTGTAFESDYFLKYLQPDGTYKYNGFGYDRGHLAPSADFRWSEKALSQSYFYSNMSPQAPEFNQERWAELESTLREYVEAHRRKVFVVTGGVLEDNLPTIGENKVSIPKYFFKVIADLDADTPAGIAFLMPNEKCEYPVMSYAVPIDSIQKITGIDFFASLPHEIEKKIESSFDPAIWQTGEQAGNVRPIHRNKLPKGAYNTVQAASHIDENGTVCGTVVSVKYVEKSGNTFINLDQKFPNQIFWCTIWKSNRVNFTYDPATFLINKKICVKGDIKLKYGKPSMSVRNEKAITILEN